DQLLILIDRMLNLRLTLSEFDNPGPIALLDGDVNQPLDSRHISRLKGKEFLENGTLAVSLIGMRSQPGAQRQNGRPEQTGGGKMACRPHDFVRSIRGLGPFEPELPY